MTTLLRERAGLALGILLWVSACGSTERSRNQSGTGGTTGGAGASSTAGTSSGAGTPSSGGANAGGSAGSGGGSGGNDINPETATEYQACFHYLKTQCNRRFYECQGLDPVDDPCPDATAWCPDFQFSEGSSLSVADVIACADRYRVASCDDLNRQVFPDCGYPPGTRQQGEACRFGTQCASLACGGPSPVPDAPDCRQCVPIGGIGAPCHIEPIACESGLECLDTGCQVALPFGLMPGAACERFGQCVAGYRCITLPGQAAPTCQELPEIGQPCPIGEGGCRGSAYCDAGTCRALPGIGMPCTELQGVYLCASEAYCDETLPGGPSCVARKPAGQPCTNTASTCAGGLSCHCSDAACASGVCAEPRQEGEPCNDGVGACVPGTACENGACVGVETQGMFAEACGL